MSTKHQGGSAFQNFKYCEISAISCPLANNIIVPVKYSENALIPETS